MDLLSFIRTADPTKVRTDERQHDEDEPKLLETIVGRVVPLILVAPAHSSSELEASLVDVVVETVVEDVAPAQPKRQKKRKTKVVDAGEPSHPAKKDMGGAMPTLPFVTSSVSTTPEREGEDHTEFLAGVNLRTIRAPQRFVISSDSSNHSGVNIAEAEVDSVVRTPLPIITSAATTTPTADPAAIAKEKLVGSSVFGVDSPSSGKSYPIPGGFFDCTGSDFLIGGIRTVIDPDSNLQKIYIPQWNVTNGSCLDDGGVCREMVDEFAPRKFFTSVRGMEHEQLYTEFNVGAWKGLRSKCQKSVKNRIISTQDWKSAAKAGSTGNFLKESSNQVSKVKDSKFRVLSCQLIKVQIKEKENQKFKGLNLQMWETTLILGLITLEGPELPYAETFL
nr:hypothetical protein [Tanacetum cinerariifolium]